MEAILQMETVSFSFFSDLVGTGGMSIYGAPFEDENLNIPLDRAGLLVMLNDGPNLYIISLFLT